MPGNGNGNGNGNNGNGQSAGHERMKSELAESRTERRRVKAERDDLLSVVKRVHDVLMAVSLEDGHAFLDEPIVALSDVISRTRGSSE